ncbi:predicted protein [Nematostella vectensis]|uniref:FAD-binding FR-type domain-containing protein n=1 Tax=Nematostella vectensis TaxID=45351 RepID=A7SD95_NEMVE|nr:predicted protein [Nematostella vectensis]|eukprot:XP_001630388.1 predicted protein [Nematostella vectensis]
MNFYFSQIIWAVINIILFATTYHNYGVTKKYTYLREVIKNGLPIARGAAMVLNFNCMLILLSMCRNLNSLIRRHCKSTCMAPVIRVLDKSITFHKYIAYTICFFTIVHVGAHCYNFENLIDSWSKENEIDAKLSQLDGADNWVNPIRSEMSVGKRGSKFAGVTGAVITLCLVVMVSSSTELIRRSYFEVFWYSHHLFIIFFAGLVAHGCGEILRYQTNMDKHDPDVCRKQENLATWGVKDPCRVLPEFEAAGAMTWKIVLLPMVIYFLERCLRFWRSMQQVKVVKVVVKHPSRVVEIQMKKPGFVCEAGQYVFLQVPKISQLEWHPFTLTSAPEEDYFSLHIRVVGNWTTDLANQLGAGNQQIAIDQMPRIAVDGPYGTASTDVFRYEVVMCIGAGIGVTPFASILKSIWYRHNQDLENLRVKKVYFYWICRDTFAFEWFSDLLKHIEIQMDEMNMPGFIQINIFLTGWDKKLANQVVMERSADRDPITGLFARTKYGRPEWAKIFNEVAEAHNQTSVGVFFCGPSGLSHELHKMCTQSCDETKGVRFFYNKENF